MYQDSNVFNELMPGNYEVVVRDKLTLQTTSETIELKLSDCIHSTMYARLYELFSLGISNVSSEITNAVREAILGAESGATIDTGCYNSYLLLNLLDTSELQSVEAFAMEMNRVFKSLKDIYGVNGSFSYYSALGPGYSTDKKMIFDLFSGYAQDEGEQVTITGSGTAKTFTLTDTTIYTNPTPIVATSFTLGFKINRMNGMDASLFGNKLRLQDNMVVLTMDCVTPTSVSFPMVETDFETYVIVFDCSNPANVVMSIYTSDGSLFVAHSLGMFNTYESFDKLFNDTSDGSNVGIEVKTLVIMPYALGFSDVGILASTIAQS